MEITAGGSEHGVGVSSSQKSIFEDFTSGRGILRRDVTEKGQRRRPVHDWGPWLWQLLQVIRARMTLSCCLREHQLPCAPCQPHPESGPESRLRLSLLGHAGTGVRVRA